MLKLSDLTSISAGHPLRGKIPAKPGSGIRVVQMKDVSSEEGIDWNRTTEVELTGKKKPDWLMDGDLLFAARGSHNYAVLVEQVRGNVVSAPHFYIIRVKESALLPGFLVWYLNQRPLQNYFEKVAEGSFTKSIRRSSLEDVEITIPPIETQKKILGLHKTLLQEKRLYADLIKNAHSVMNTIASKLAAGKF